MITSLSAIETGSVALQKRVGGGMKWGEVRERATRPDGSVRTSPRIIRSSIANGLSPSTMSPPRPGFASRGLGKLGRLSSSGGSLPAVGNAPSSRGGSSRGDAPSSRGGSSRGGSSGRDGDISSRCSSGGWDTCTNCSEPSRPRTPLDIAPSPTGGSSLLMPDPVRTGLLLPPSLLDEETVQQPIRLTGDSVSKLEEPYADEESHEVAVIVGSRISAAHGPAPGSFKGDPHGRDVPKRFGEVRSEWSLEPLLKYLKKAALQIEANIETHRLPTAEKLDAFVTRLVANTHRLLKHAPKDLRRTLQSMISRRFQRFWNFVRNEKLRSTNPEELKSAMTLLIEALTLEVVVSPATLAEPERLHAPLAKHHNTQRSLVVDPCGRV